MSMKSHIKHVIDLCMTVALLLLMANELIGQEAHEWIGTVMFVLMITHNILNLTWYRNMLKGKYNAFRVFQLIMDWSVFLCMIGLMVSGIMLSRHVFNLFPNRSGSNFARTLHMLCAYWGFCLMSLHVGLHTNMMMSAMRKATHISQPSIVRTIVLRVVAVLICAYGVYAFAHRQIGSYMFLRNMFVFFDFSEPLIYFFADYLAIMGMFVVAGHYVSGLLKRINIHKLKGEPKMRKDLTKNLVLSALFMAVGIVLPFLTGQIPQIGNMLLPMHLPVLLCGILCGWQYGGVIGFILPILRFFLFGMPPLFPIGIAMTFEMLTYGVVIGLIYARLPKNVWGLYLSLIPAMLVGRVVWGVVRVLLSGVSDNAFTWQLFMSGAFLTAIPGIILQLAFIPAFVFTLQKAGVLSHESPNANDIAPSAVVETGR